ncbi:DUF3885 domain-containing protein [Aminipila sp.]|uniref:DUF3885 domain-containing protein n=1 Tax=Aminipila sp. TaxID=2060095 RepID=UPI0028976EF9|nr:DUF3885 domain-containing protein [Aminipila sp.]
MNFLYESFSNAVRKIGMQLINKPILYNAPIGIRFEIGGDESVYIDNLPADKNLYNLEYVNAAVNRAISIYLSLPHPPNILRIDTYPDEEYDLQEDTLEKLIGLGLPHPDEQKMVFLHQENEYDSINQLQSYWSAKEPFCYQPLLKEIIVGDIGGSISELVSNVYFVNSDDCVLFHLYDDRGADLAAADKELLRPIYEKYNAWILDYDREQISKIFDKCT